MLSSSRAKIYWAKYRLREVDHFIKRFSDSKPYTVTTESDQQRGLRIYRIKHLHDIPDDVPLVIADCIHNCRVALDHLAWDLVRKGGRCDPRKVEPRFPIHGSRDDFYRLVCRDIDGAPSSAIRIMERLKPYRSGNDLLWLLGELNNRDKHRLLAVIIPEIHSVNLDIVAQMERLFPDFFGVAMPSLALPLTPANRSAQDGDEVFSSPLDAPLDENLTVTIQIAFDEPGIPIGEPVQTLLGQFVSLVERIVNIFDRFIFSVG